MDTSVLVAALFNKKPGRLLQQWRSGQFIWCCSPDVLREYERILTKIPVIRKSGIQLIQELKEDKNVIWKEKPPKVHIQIDDPDDVKFVSCAASADADYLISLDDHLLSLDRHDGTDIIRPGEYFAKYPSGLKKNKP